MLSGFRRRFGRRPSDRSRSPQPEKTDAANDKPETIDSTPSKSEEKPGRSRSVDLGKVMIPSPPRGSLEAEDILGTPVWLKVRIGASGNTRRWYQCLGKLSGYAPGGVRGESRLEIYIQFFDQSVIVDPKYLEDYGHIGKNNDTEVEKAKTLITEQPEDAITLGFDIKGYIVPDTLVPRLQAWEGREVGSGQRIDSETLGCCKRDLGSFITKHSAGYVKGEVWPSWPAEAELGLDKHLEETPLPRSQPTRRRSRSRSHSLSRAMKEEDDRKVRESATPPTSHADAEQEETTGAAIVEAYETAIQTGQTHEEALDTVRIIYEVDAEEVKQHLKTYVRRHCGTQDATVSSCINLLKKMSSMPEVIAAPRGDSRPQPQRQTTPEGGATLFGAPFKERNDGGLIKPAGGHAKVNPLLEGSGVVNQLFDLGNLDREDEGTRAGAGGEGEDNSHIAARVVHALEGLRKATEGDRKSTPGTRSSIGSEEALDVYLARGCNTLTVEVCPDATGKELFDALKRACSHAKAKLQQIEWPCLVTNGIAYGLAAMHHGGKDHTTLPPWALSVAHAVTARPRDFDQYEAPKDDKVEPKPRYPTHFATWLKQARNEINMIGSVLGLEHKKERLAALEQIEKAHEKDVDVWPENYCYSLWEELKAAWVEELRESRRKLCRILNTDNPRKEDLKFVALAPGSGFKFPKTFDLGHPEGYYQQVCVPRQARALKGIIYGQLHHKRHAPAPKVGENLDESDHATDTQPSGGGEAGDRVGKGKEKGDKDAKRKKEKDDKKAYPAGKRLRPKEASDSVKHAPRTKDGKPICWDSASHMGCSRGKDCSHAHQPITTTKGIHWTVLAQLIRRGGLRNGPIIHPNQVDGRIAQLRTQAKAETDEKISEGSSQKQGWLPPSEYEDVQYTQLEEELRELTRGPDYGWLRDYHAEELKVKNVWDRRVDHPEAQRRLEELKKLEKAGKLEGMGTWSPYLQSHVRSRILNAHMEGNTLDIDEVLLEATEKGCPELAQEAEKVLNEQRTVGWQEQDRQAWIGALIWSKEKGYGEGKFEFQCGGEHQCWRYLDYRDRLPVPPELASALGMQEGEEEERQCLVLHPAAGCLMWDNNWNPDAPPSLAEVQEAAQALRAELWDDAAGVVSELGDPAPWIGAHEAEVRGYAHDVLRAHHDKDYRLFQVFGGGKLQGYTLQCWRWGVAESTTSLEQAREARTM